MKLRLLKACAACSAILLLCTIFLWVRSYRYLDSVSWWGPVRLEIWNHEGKIGLYVNNNTPPVALITERFTWTTISEKEFEILPGSHLITIGRYDTRNAEKASDPAPLIPLFKFRLINGNYPEIEIPHWFLFLSISGLEALCVYFLIRLRRRARLQTTVQAVLDVPEAPRPCEPPPVERA